MGNTAEIFRQCPPSPSTNFDDFFILLANDNLRNTADQLCNCGVLRDAFIFYFRNSPWINELLEYFAACDTSGRCKVSDEQGSQLITYLASVGTLWTSKDERDPSFYLQTPQMPGCSNSNSSTSSFSVGRVPFSPMRSFMSNKLQILPVAIALAIGCYIRSGQYQRDKDSLCSFHAQPTTPNNTVMSLLGVKPHRFSSDTFCIHSSSSSPSRVILPSKAKERDSESTNSDFPTVIMVPPSSNPPNTVDITNTLDAYARLRGLLNAVIEDVGDAEYLDFLLAQREEGETSSSNAEEQKLVVLRRCEEIHKCSPSTSLVWLKQLFHFFESFPVAISIASTKRNKQATFPLVYINQVFEDITQYKRIDVLGQNCRFLHSEECTEYGQRDRIRDSLHDMVASRLGLTNVRKDGTPFYNLLSLQPIFRPILHNKPINMHNNSSINKNTNKSLFKSSNSVHGDADANPLKDKITFKYTMSTSENKFPSGDESLLYKSTSNDNVLEAKTAKCLSHDTSDDLRPKLDENNLSDNTILEEEQLDEERTIHPSTIEYTFSHVVGIQYEMKARDEVLMDDLQVVEDIIVLLYGILII